MGCNIHSDPSKLPDYDNSEGLILDFWAGERFETLKPMFLTRPTREGLGLVIPGIGSPSLEEYAADSDRFDYVEALVPSGIVFEVVATKDGGLHTPLTFVRLPNVAEWVWVMLDERTKIGANHHLQYNREYFRKIEEPETSPTSEEIL
jgi:hypothetical protein